MKNTMGYKKKKPRKKNRLYGIGTRIFESYAPRRYCIIIIIVMLLYYASRLFFAIFHE